MGQTVDKYTQINSSEDDALFRDIVLGKTISEVNEILSQGNFHYHNKLIKEVCDGDCSEFCDHLVMVDTEDGLITAFYID